MAETGRKRIDGNKRQESRLVSYQKKSFEAGLSWLKDQTKIGWNNRVRVECLEIDMYQLGSVLGSVSKHIQEADKLQLRIKSSEMNRHLQPSQ